MEETETPTGMSPKHTTATTNLLTAAAKAGVRHGRDSPQWIPDVAEGLLDAEGGEDDPCHHRQVQVAVGVSRQPRPLLSPRGGEPPLGG